jgi:hypothetical protein
MPKDNPKGNELEGAQDQGGKRGGQAGVPEPPPRPTKTEHDQDTPRASPGKR